MKMHTTVSSLVIHLQKLDADQHKACIQQVKDVEGLEIVELGDRTTIAAVLEAPTFHESAQRVREIEELKGVQVVQLVYCQTDVPCDEK